jgi:hypothetical protein
MCGNVKFMFALVFSNPVQPLITPDLCRWACRNLNRGPKDDEASRIGSGDKQTGQNG